MAWPDSDYPGALDSPPDPDTTLDGTPLHSELHLWAGDAIDKLQQTLGTNPSMTLAAAAARVGGIRIINATGAGTTSGTTPLVLMTTSFSVAASGMVDVGFTTHGTKSAAADRFDVVLRVNGNAVASSFNTASITGYLPYAASFVAAVPAGTVTVDVVATRFSGSGTCTFAGGAPSRLSGIYVPN